MQTDFFYVTMYQKMSAIHANMSRFFIMYCYAFSDGVLVFHVRNNFSINCDLYMQDKLCYRDIMS